MLTSLLVCRFNSLIYSSDCNPILFNLFIHPMYNPAVPSCRSISYLSVLLKLFQRLVVWQFHAHLISTRLRPRFQSAYWAHHSNETSISKVLSDILLDAVNLSVELCWTGQWSWTGSIMDFVFVDWINSIKTWDQYNSGFSRTCQTDYSTWSLLILKLLNK